MTNMKLGKDDKVAGNM